MSETAPTVSVCMAVYNAERYLRDAIASILNQTFTDFEFLIIDDGSRDQSAAILADYAARDARIRWSSQANQGISRTRNKMLHQAKGEFIAVMDADDVAKPERFAHQVNYLNSHPEIVCLGTSFDLIDEKCRWLECFHPPTADVELQKLMIQGISWLLHSSAMVRREPMVSVGGYNENMIASIDLDLWLRLGEVGQLANLDKIIMQYRVNRRSISHRKHELQRHYAREACEQAWGRRGIQGQFVGDYTNRLHQHSHLLEWGWRGFSRGQRDVAFDYGLDAVRLRPFSIESWRLLVCAMIKPLPQEIAD
jgi:glycosyltransferase involved in cell wall biosynthesis